MNNYFKKSWVEFLKMKDEFYDWFICMVLKLEMLNRQGYIGLLRASD